VVLRRWELEFNQFRLHHAYRTCGTSHYIPSCLTALLACYGPLYLSALGKPVVLEGYSLSTFYSYGAIETSADTAHHRIPLLTFSLDGTRFDLALDLSMHFDLDVSNLGEREPPASDFIAILRVREAIIAVAAFEPVE